MIYKIKTWYARNSFEIAWFIIGWCSAFALACIGRGDLIGALACGGLAYFNYALAVRR